MARDRMLFVDNIRLVMIILVVCHHAVITYGGLGAWYYRDPVTAGPVARLLFFLFLSFNQSFFMATLFICGYRSSLKGLVISAGLSYGIYLLFVKILSVPLPSLGQWF